MSANTEESTSQVHDLQAQLDALHRSLAVISFQLDGTILDANENFLQALGYTREEIAGQHHRLFVPPEQSASKEYAEFWRHLAAGEFQSGEFLRIGRGGREVWIQATYNPVFDRDGKPVKIVKFATDITAAKVASANASGQLTAIHRAQAVIEFDLHGNVLDANENFLATVGYTKEEVVGSHHRMFVRPDYARSPEYGAFWSELRAGKLQAGVFQRVDRNGGDIWLQASYNPIYDASGRLSKVVKFATDITASTRSRIAFQRGMQSLIERCSDGELDARGSVDGLDAELGEVMVSVNALLDTIARPTLVTTDRIAEIARGAAPPAIDEDWKGAFGVLRDGINALIHSSADIAEVIQGIANGDLTIDAVARSEEDAVMHSIGRMIRGLAEALSEVERASGEVLSGSGQVATASQSVSDNSTQSAASIEEISASSEAIAQQTQTNADHATQALELADAVRARAEDGDREMQGMVEAMGEIERMGKEISKIVKVIDEIAFQ
ncbi:MAG: PAS domain S-box protein, partial [Myxococcales bacterium]|nr:PAS domain S-box protein [Myxococcales bacterium]